MQVVARIQGHPARDHLHGRLADLLGVPTQVMVHSSDPPSPWGGYKACLEDLPDCSHLLIVQDDALPCRNFSVAVEQIARRHPSTPVVLFLAKMPRRTSVNALKASKAGQRYVPLFFHDFLPMVAVLWPRAKAEEFREWAKDAKLPGQPNPRSDDAAGGHWMRTTRQRVLATVPSLVDHDSSQASVKGTPNAASAFRALLLAEDALDYQW